MLVRLFPTLDGIGFTHPLGRRPGRAPRPPLPGIGYDRETGFAWAGGYTGQGVAASNAAGRGLADLVRGVDSDLTRLPWVGHRSRPWEPEPLRWLAVHTVASLAHITDARDRHRGTRTSPP